MRILYPESEWRSRKRVPPLRRWLKFATAVAMKTPFRIYRLCIALLVWIATSYLLAAGMAGFAEPHESFVGLMLFALVISTVLHGALIVTTLFRPQFRSAMMWALAVGLLPATVLSGIVLTETVTKLPSQIAGFAVASLILLVYADAWRLLLLRGRRPDHGSHIAAS